MEQLPEEEYKKKCEICDIVCCGPIPFKMHIESPKHHKAKLKKSLEKEYEGMYTGRFSCRKCAKTLPDIFNLKMHLDNNDCEKILQKSHVQEILELGNLCRATIVQNSSNDTISDGSFAVGLKFFICTLCSKILRSSEDAEKHHKECQHILPSPDDEKNNSKPVSDSI